MVSRLLLVCVFLSAAVPAQSISEWLRYPAISPDGQHIAFSALGDLWLVASTGGDARPLTSGGARDFAPVWSPDGKWIAFASDRHGNDDVFVMPATGGPAKRLTFHSVADQPSSFTPDGSAVLFRSARGPGVNSLRFPSSRQAEVWEVTIASGKVRRVVDTPAEQASINPATGQLLYEDKPSIENEWRKRQRSSAARDIWAYDAEARTHQRWTNFAGEDREPRWHPRGGIVYLSEQFGTLNVCVLRQPMGEPSRLTTFTDHPVRHLSVAENGDVAFGWHGQIFVRPWTSSETRKVEVRLSRDVNHLAPENRRITSGASEMLVSPDGKEVAFIVRGEVFVTATKGGETRRITNTPAQERWLTWAPDGRSLAYATERHGGWDIYRAKLVRKDDTHFFRATVIEEEALVRNAGNTFQPSYSPAGGELAFIEARTALKVLDLETKKERTVLPAERNVSYADGDQEYTWSPDGKWLLVTFLQDGYWVDEVGLVDAKGGVEPINLSRNGFADYRPRWAPELNAVIWFSNRDGKQSVANTGSREADVYATFLTRAAADRFRLSKEEQEWLDDADKGKKKPEKKEGADGKDEKKALEIEADGIADRRVRLTVHSAAMGDALVRDGGKKLVYLARFERGFDLWVTDLRSRETKILAKLGGGGGRLLPAKKGNEVWLLSGGSISKVDVNSGKRTRVSFRAEMRLDRHAERMATFDHVRRTVKAKFYEPTLHGTKWDAMCDAYETKLSSIAHDRDFAEALSELLGELNASHTGARFRGPSPDGDSTASLGLLYDESFAGPGLKVAAILDRGPFDRAESRLRVGHVIEGIDGVSLVGEDGAAPSIAQLLNRKSGQRVLVAVYDPEKKERFDEQVRAVSGGAQSQMLYRRWVDRQRVLTEKLSGGRLGYVHVRNMSDSSYRTVFEEVLGRHVDKEALIVDTRFNGGGDLVDDLSRFLRGREYMKFKSPDGRTFGGEPMRQWTKPSIVLMSEGNYSDAHCFPFAFKELGIGKLVGMPVAGTCTFVWWERTQIPGLVYGIPNLGVLDVRGNFLENLQLEPDIRVEPDRTKLANGEDEQLAAAVQALLADLPEKR